MPTMDLSHSLRVLSKNTQKCAHNVSSGLFSKNSQQILKELIEYITEYIVIK